MKLVKSIVGFGGLFSAIVLCGASSVFGQEAAAVASSAGNDPEVLKYLALASAFAIGIAATGVGLGQGKAVSAAMEGISRNPQAQGQMMAPLILGLAFMEALVIFTLIFGFVFKLTVLS